MKHQQKLNKELEKLQLQIYRETKRYDKLISQIQDLKNKAFELDVQIGKKQRLLEKFPPLLEETGKLQEITMDLITQMRLEGRSFEAEQLLKAYHLNKSKQKLQDKKEIKSIQWKKKRLLEGRNDNISSQM